MGLKKIRRKYILHKELHGDKFINEKVMKLDSLNDFQRMVVGR